MAVRILFAIVAVAPLLAACPAPVTLDMGRLGNSHLAEDTDTAAYQVMEAGEPLRRCGFTAGIGDRQPDIAVIDSSRFWRTAFPDPVPHSTIETLLADPEVSNRLAELDVDYVVAVGGRTSSTQMNGSMQCGGQGCAGAMWNEEWTDLEASVWDLEAGAPVDAVVAKGSAKTIVAALIVPFLWLEPYTRSTTCRNMGREVGALVAERHGDESALVAVVGISGSAFQLVEPDDLDDLAAAAEDGDEAALYDLAVHFQRVGDWNTIPYWQTETHYRLALVSTGEERWQWLCRAAHAGHAAAQAQAGWAFEAGYYTEEAVRSDPVEAYKWYWLALLNGEISAAEDLARLDEILTPEQVAEAQGRASEWQPGGCVEPQPAAS